jgi:hypothetical protein
MLYCVGIYVGILISLICCCANKEVNRIFSHDLHTLKQQTFANKLPDLLINIPTPRFKTNSFLKKLLLKQKG